MASATRKLSNARSGCAKTHHMSKELKECLKLNRHPLQQIWSGARTALLGIIYINAGADLCGLPALLRWTGRNQALERNRTTHGTKLAWHINGWEDRAPLTIWMDGRPHPSESVPHPAGGFVTGKWENDVLVAYTTHMQAGLVRRSGAFLSDQATMTVRFFHHGDELTVTARIDDLTI